MPRGIRGGRTGGPTVSPEEVKAAVTKALTNEVAEQMVRGWSILDRGWFWKERIEKDYDGIITREDFKEIEKAARAIIREHWEDVSREDLVAQSLQKLEYIAKESIKYKQMSTAQACIATMLKATGADAPKQKNA